ncbi:DUF4245 domain-containing protein [Streptomyces sp. DSM 42041]|uniref:DUF4245 domain-containing protein n=1 Tax=Streptomyces hazeniae TaxID=3075538 RepID=A0ABU2NPJ9_9ACTN|nr:DUF4245 domain-containing protein [Streptomyces sp. DSM 42041]MDT0377942.1 DUF4245 domain-containing protein [Streptomyces sp. DSM 42041]
MAAEKKRGTQTIRDMVFSVAVVALAAGVIYLFIPHDGSKDPVRVVDYSVEVKTASRAAPYPIATPEGLPQEWRATSVRYEGAGGDGAAWHLGFMAPGNEYAAVEQSDADPRGFVDDVTYGAEKTGRSVHIEGETWTRYAGEKYDALVRVQPDVTTVVTGTAPAKQLERLAAALEPRTAKS